MHNYLGLFAEKNTAESCQQSNPLHPSSSRCHPSRAEPICKTQEPKSSNWNRKLLMLQSELRAPRYFHFETGVMSTWFWIITAYFQLSKSQVQSSVWKHNNFFSFHLFFFFLYHCEIWIRFTERILFYAMMRHYFFWTRAVRMFSLRGINSLCHAFPTFSLCLQF